jgi:PTH1 family peptidyl-tRNA hydrolase
MFLIVGLGNPGKQYAKNRHNAGFLALEQIAADHKLAEQTEKFNSRRFEGKIGDHKIIAIMPQSYMNLSGIAVSQFVKFYKIPPKNIIVIFDDLDLDCARVKTKVGGSDGGHNGIKSINSYLKNEYLKIRIGISRPKDSSLVAKFVLSDFTMEETLKINNILEKISKNFEKILDNRPDLFMNLIKD